MEERLVHLSNGIGLNVKYKKNRGPALLFLHFSGGTNEMWNGVIPLFDKEYTIIAPDIRGHGKSDRPDTGYHIDDMANDIHLLLKELEINSCQIIGSSMGAEVGLSLAASHPEMIASIVCEGAMYNEFGEYGLFRGTEEEITQEKERQLHEMNRRVLPVYPSIKQYTIEMQKQLTEHGVWSDSFVSYFKSCLHENDQDQFEHHYKNHVRKEYIQKYWGLKFEEYYQKITCPVLFLPTEEEWENEKIRQSTYFFASFLNSFKILPLRDSMHAYVWMQHPGMAGETVRTFLEEQ
ncbi:alpha/beta fold hydrolase [Bacillus salacetis]|uniref:alpha/beta fold hydrolase n=1 Tax=Bacillus salacetis TaxID=2315464 RepID=UPI003BA262AC